MDLYVIRNGSLTSARHRDEIIAPSVCPYVGAYGPGFALLDDNARPHRLSVVAQQLE